LALPYCEPERSEVTATASAKERSKGPDKKILFSYSGWQNVNYVLNDVKDPVRTLKIAGPLGLGITSVLYILANISYFAYVDLAHYPVTVP
jgi:hypothetical protein